MIYDQHINNSFGGGVRNEPQWKRILEKAQNSLLKLHEDYSNHRYPFMHQPSDEESLTTAIRCAAQVKAMNCKDIVLIGTGGSSFGAAALSSLIRAKNASNEPKLHILDNADPATARSLYKSIDPAKTVFMLISKSGKTAEVLMHSMFALNFMKKQVGEENLKSHFYVITEPNPSPLRDLAEKYDLPAVEHHPEIGGRYSVLSVVGMLPAACIGIDVEEIRQGAETTLKQTLEASTVDESHAAIGAALAAYHLENGRNIQVLMPYCDHLREFGDWHKQLVSESLGKEGKGITPLYSRGAVDQHSMLQLFLEGPDDKWFTLIIGNQKGTGDDLGEEDHEALKYLNGRTMGDVLESLQQGTIQTLINNNRPLRIVNLHDYTSESAMGALLMHCMLEVILTADIMGINPYDQPAVEEGKILAREYLENIA